MVSVTSSWVYHNDVAWNNDGLSAVRGMDLVWYALLCQPVLLQSVAMERKLPLLYDKVFVRKAYRARSLRGPPTDFRPMPQMQMFQTQAMQIPHPMRTEHR